MILRAPRIFDVPAVGGELAVGSAEGIGMVDVGATAVEVLVYGMYEYVVSLAASECLLLGLGACGEDDIWDASRVAVVHRDKNETRSKRLEPSRARSTLGSSSFACVCVCIHACKYVCMR